MQDDLNISDGIESAEFNDIAINDTKAVTDNIENTVNRILKDARSVDANLSELGYIALLNCDTRDDLQNYLTDVFQSNEQVPQRDFSASSLESITKLGRIQLFGTFGKLLQNGNVKLLNDILEAIMPQGEPTLPSASGKIAYFRNSQSDTAFLQFSAIPGKKNAKAVYFSNFSDVCEEVYNRICEYCILPIDNSVDGKLRGFYSLIRKYDLHIISVCDIMSTDKLSSTRFALLTKNSSKTLEELALLGKDSIFELSVIPDVYPTLHDIITAAVFCGLETTRIDSIPTEDDGIYETNLQFYAKNADLLTFLMFLSFDSPHCSIIGIYKKNKLRKD